MQAPNEAAANDAQIIFEKIRGLAADFAGERSERQQRRELVQADFDRLRDTGFLLTAVPVEQGGIWESFQRSNRAICVRLPPERRCVQGRSGASGRRRRMSSTIPAAFVRSRKPNPGC